MNLQPVISDVADLFWWKMRANLTSIVANAVGSFESQNIKTLPGSVFVFVAWRGCSSWDPVTQLRAAIGASPGTAATALYPTNVPNNFEVMVKRNNRFNMMDDPMPQACIASNGYRAGNQVPLPIIYPPATTFNITIFNTAPVQLTEADTAVPKVNIVDFGLFGYNVPSENLGIFLNQWPALYGKALRTLTGITAPLGVP